MRMPGRTQRALAVITVLIPQFVIAADELPEIPIGLDAYRQWDKWPVQRIGPDYRPAEPPDAPTLLLVRRDGAGDVRFAEISPLVYRLLELLGSDEPRSGRETLLQLAGEAGAGDTEAFVNDGAAMLRQMRAEGTLIGTALHQ